MVHRFTLVSLVALFCGLSCFAAGPRIQTVYGDDNRLDVYESDDWLLNELARSTAAMIPVENLLQKGRKYVLQAQTLAEKFGVCASERFSAQPAAASCSGFLVAPDLLVTAGHCIKDLADCDPHRWVFDYANVDSEKTGFSFKQSQIFRCVEIIDRVLDNTSRLNDYVLVRLDRPARNRTPFQYRTSGKIADDTPLTVIGYPSGVPVKIASDAQVRDNSNEIYFMANTDSFGVSSGSPVIDTVTGMVEGILVRGDQDYTMPEEGDNACKNVIRRDQDGGRAEDVTRITNLKIPRCGISPAPL